MGHTAGMNITAAEKQRFTTKFIKGAKCWLWRPTGRVGARTGPKYGVFKLRSMPSATTAHRASWLIYNGAIPKGLSVCHRCDTPLCVRPTHLFLGTPLDNSRDMVAKGRHVHGERAVHGKLTSKQVLQIRAAYDAGTTPTVLSKRFKLHVRTVWNIIKRERWAHLK